MCKTKILSVVGVSAIIAWAVVTVGGEPVFGGTSAEAQARTAALAAPIDRTRKSDRLPTAATTRPEAKIISTVEVVGVRDAAIVYRDRDGRVLYKSDPLTNATVVTKGVVLPEVTVRETQQSPVRPVATDAIPPRPALPNQPAASSNAPAKPAAAPAGRPRIPEGCDPAASPIAAPQLAHILSKCLVEAPTATNVKLAALM
ncbi:hypothetical protein PQJ75_23440 [Rhodoplanes sp. TEM]|uniref:Uncharacterized protein n=1 Tax=Rhodoplanes tepidamans TaxID=200616 RepID=A0ABT5J6E2_RHOTP|nr:MULTISPECIES: hypothetical protein [Rhodoplanes]MDC7785002.1 hypothetical protein [Rhodoplanes tepidamans]MDC7986693.1 hypothetical protein [Rhodoplanes sp. TEM]MDQ0353766.1 hypothetical protein [Rhodoplanes tepidamans]